MPIYEFQCGKCHTVFEELVMNRDETDILCPACKSRKVQKLISKTGKAGLTSTAGSSCAGNAVTGFS